MASTDPFEVYKLYIAVKSHFTSKSYDFFKYGGKTSVKHETYLSRKDKYFYGRLAKKYTLDMCLRVFVNEFYKSPKVWIGTIDEEASLREIDRRWEGLEYRVRCDIDMIFQSKDQAVKMFKGNPPEICNMIMGQQILPESAILILTSLSDWDTIAKRAEAIPIWDSYQTRLQKYSGFIPWTPEIRRSLTDHLNKTLSEIL